MATTQELLDEALAVRHQLMLGKRHVRLSFGERSIEYSRSNLTDLDRYIAQLRRTLSGATAPSRIRYVVPL